MQSKSQLQISNKTLLEKSFSKSLVLGLEMRSEQIPWIRPKDTIMASQETGSQMRYSDELSRSKGLWENLYTKNFLNLTSIADDLKEMMSKDLISSGTRMANRYMTFWRTMIRDSSHFHSRITSCIGTTISQGRLRRELVRICILISNHGSMT